MDEKIYDELIFDELGNEVTLEALEELSNGKGE